MAKTGCRWQWPPKKNLLIYCKYYHTTHKNEESMKEDWEQCAVRWVWRRPTQYGKNFAFVCVRKYNLWCTTDTPCYCTSNTKHMHETLSNQHCKHINTACNWGGLWMTCYLVISRKLRRVERSSRRLICLWHWLQKKSSASSLRKLWKQSGSGAGALERGNK